MDINGITQIISQMGFPIFVAVWLLFKGEQQNKNMVEALGQLRGAVNILSERLRCEDNGK